MKKKKSIFITKTDYSSGLRIVDLSKKVHNDIFLQTFQTPPMGTIDWLSVQALAYVRELKKKKHIAAIKYWNISLDSQCCICIKVTPFLKETHIPKYVQHVKLLS